jgi:pseudouridine-5'-phosphate glycosidase
MKYPLKLSRDVATALNNYRPVVALESTIISHGMPFPDNIAFSNKAENVVTDGGAVPATIAIIHGIIHVGLDESQLRYIADTNNKIEKIATRDIGFAVANKLSGATTVSATMHIAHLVGIKVFATGGIGGVHRNAENTFDVSQDLIELSRTPIIVVSAGVKAILDIPKTLEQLETLAVSVVGYKTNEFPAFYSRFSGSQLANKYDSPEGLAAIFKSQNNLKIKSALLVANPVPEADEIPKNEIDNYIGLALKECNDQGIKGKAVTPFLLKHIVELTEGKSLKANIALALNNVQVATEIAKELK